MEMNFLLSTVGFWLLFSFLSYLGEKVLVIKGYVRGSTFGLIVISFFLALFRQADPTRSLIVYILLALIVSPLVINRYDLSLTINKGKWWWKSDDNN